MRFRVRFDKDTSMKWLVMESPSGFPLAQYPLSYEPQDRKIRLRASVRCGKGPLTVGAVAKGRTDNKLEIKRVCIDETP